MTADTAAKADRRTDTVAEADTNRKVAARLAAAISTARQPDKTPASQRTKRLPAFLPAAFFFWIWKIRLRIQARIGFTMLPCTSVKR